MPVEPNRARATVVFSDLDGILLDPDTPAFEKAAHLLAQIIPGDVALVLCSGRTRAELEYIQRRLRVHDPFVCEFGAAAFIPSDYFRFEVPSSRDAVGHRVMEFGTAYSRVVESLRLIAKQKEIEIIRLSDLSLEDVARQCHVPLCQARLMTSREYTEGFQIRDDTLASYHRLFRALNAAQLRGIVGDTFNFVGGLIDHRVGVRFLSALYRRTFIATRTVGVTHVGVDDDNLSALVDHCITVPDDEAERDAIDIVDWAKAIVDVVGEFHGATTCRRATSAAD
jgi:mannosyl-3-phosphoglycerate phosphatase